MKSKLFLTLALVQFAFGANYEAQFTTGVVSSKCLQCICDKETGCQPRACRWDGSSNSCGYFQINRFYWINCGSPGGDFVTCAMDLQCSSLCVQKFMDTFRKQEHCSKDCESYARLHNGGPEGCSKSTTAGYWNHIQTLGCDKTS